jgi:hypothetical protein
MRLRRAVRGCGRTISSLAHLRGEERRLYLAAWWTLLACRLRLRFPELLNGRRLLAGAFTGRGASRRSLHSIGRLAAVFRRAHRDQLVASSCLPRSVALLRFLARNGVAARLELGLRRDTAGLTGHAWVVHDGEPVNDSSAFVGRYVRLLRAEPSDASGPSAPAPPRG